MSRSFLFLNVLWLITLGQVSGAQNKAPQAEVAGTVTYRQRVALPPNAVVDVRLEDVSRMDAPAKLIGETVFDTAGKQVPLPFRISYSTSDIDPTHHYQVRASILAGGRLLFTSDTAYRVITHSDPTQLVIVLQQVDDSYAPQSSATKLQGTHWQLRELNGKPVAGVGGGKEASLVIHARSDEMVATSGCNSFLGTYTLAQSTLQLKPTKNTMIPCPPALQEQDKAFLAALKTTSSYRIQNQTLELLEGEKVLAVFEAAQPK